MNFAVTDSYVLHQAAWFSATPDTDLSQFLDLAWMPIIDSATLRKIWTIRVSPMNSTSVLERFIAYAESVTKRATRAVNRIWTTSILDSRLRKVPNSEIYVIEWDITLDALHSLWRPWSTSSPRTLIVRNGNVTLRGSFGAHAMIIASEWYIDFVPQSCSVRDTVSWIFIGTRWVVSRPLRNNSLHASQRCSGWGLTIAWVVMWPQWFMTALSQNRRAVLDQWFNVRSTSQLQKVLLWSSVLIQSNPWLWRNLPPGTDIFNDILQIWK
jgi:hypothetical protein